MTDFTAGTDLCFTKSNSTSPHLLLFCTCTFGSYPELVSLQTTPNKHRDITPSLGCCGYSVPAEGCTAQPPRHWGTKPLWPPLPWLAQGERDRASHALGIQPARALCPPNSLPAFIASLNGRSSILGHLYSYVTNKPSSRGLFSTVPSCPEQFSHLTPTGPCSIPLLQHLLWPSIPTATPASLSLPAPHEFIGDRGLKSLLKLHCAGFTAALAPHSCAGSQHSARHHLTWEVNIHETYTQYTHNIHVVNTQGAYNKLH